MFLGGGGQQVSGSEVREPSDEVRCYESATPIVCGGIVEVGRGKALCDPQVEEVYTLVHSKDDVLDQGSFSHSKEGPQTRTIKVVGEDYNEVVGPIGMDDMMIGNECLALGISNHPPPRAHRQRRRFLWELGDCSSQLQRNLNSEMGSPQVGSCSSSRVSSNSNALSDGDIVNYNSHLWSFDDVDVPSNVGELGKHLGVSCDREEEDVVKELECMEERDSEVLKKFEDGNNGVVL